ncbi:MAG: acetyl-CoA carboxylase biotin carboxyl carrier protein, partial [Chlamydiia bacterium]|nr:acetyl-CoA carboxylase biotin carboxyl carrier protein [Chlamydiia bacterium]
MQAMGRYSIRRLSLKREGVELELESVSTEAEKIQAPVSEMVYEKSAGEQHENPFSAHARQKLKNIPDVPSEEENLLYITSPIVGTFYSQPAPNASPFIKAGDKVSSESIVCIIEAMKVMNEIKA